jgi:hypothetical protein
MVLIDEPTSCRTLTIFYRHIIEASLFSFLGDSDMVMPKTLTLPSTSKVDMQLSVEKAAQRKANGTSLPAHLGRLLREEAPLFYQPENGAIDEKRLDHVFIINSNPLDSR